MSPAAEAAPGRVHIVRGAAVEDGDVSNDLPTRLRAEAQTAPDHTAALLLEAADAYDKLLGLWTSQIARMAQLGDELTLALAALEQAQGAALEWERRAKEAAK